MLEQSNKVHHKIRFRYVQVQSQTRKSSVFTAQGVTPEPWVQTSRFLTTAPQRDERQCGDDHSGGSKSNIYLTSQRFLING